MVISSGSDDRIMKQTSFASLEYAGKKRKTKREKFLAEMGGDEPDAPIGQRVALTEYDVFSGAAGPL